MGELVDVMNPATNYKTYREHWRRIPASQPAIPYMGMYLTDLTFTDEGNPDTVGKGLINFDKWSKVARSVRELLRFQQVLYSLKPQAQVAKLLGGDLSFALLGEEEAYQLSLKFEPRK